MEYVVRKKILLYDYIVVVIIGIVFAMLFYCYASNPSKTTGRRKERDNIYDSSYMPSMPFSGAGPLPSSKKKPKNPYD